MQSGNGPEVKGLVISIPVFLLAVIPASGGESEYRVFFRKTRAYSAWEGLYLFRVKYLPELPENRYFHRGCCVRC